MISKPFNGFNGSVWSVALASMEYLATQIANTSDFISIQPVIDATLQTLLNGVDTINLFNYYNSWQVELNNFEQIIQLPLANVPGGLVTAQSRKNTYETAITALGFNFVVPSLNQVAQNLSFGQPAITDPQLLNFCFNFNVEQAPTGLTPANFQTNLQTLSDNFALLAANIAVTQGVNLTTTYDAAVRQHSLTQIQANLAAQLHSSDRGSGLSSVFANIELGVGVAGRDINYIWNQIAVLPTLLKDAELIGNAPYLENTQQALLQKFIMLTMAQNLAIFLLTLQQPLTQNIQLTRISNGQTLMDVAAQKLQNFEGWKALAQANNLRPPWVVQASNDPTIAQWGQQLVLPGSQTREGTPPSYLNNFLGIDVYLGQIASDMPAWNGDFQTVSGYSNLRISLARRLLTAIGTLIYHSQYGSEIPTMIGTIATQGEAAYITALASSALLSDPRVAQVVNAQTQVLPDFAFGYTGTVIPNGLTEQTVVLNEVLS